MLCLVEGEGTGHEKMMTRIVVIVVLYITSGYSRQLTTYCAVGFTRLFPESSAHQVLVVGAGFCCHSVEEKW